MNELEKLLEMINKDGGRNCGRDALKEGGLLGYDEHLITCSPCWTHVIIYGYTPESIHNILKKYLVIDVPKYDDKNGEVGPNSLIV